MEDEAYSESWICSALRSTQVVGLPEGKLPTYSMRTGRGVGRGGHRARGPRAAPRALAGVFAAPATVHQTLHHTHQSKGVEFFIKARELGVSQVQRLLGKGIKLLL